MATPGTSPAPTPAEPTQPAAGAGSTIPHPRLAHLGTTVFTVYSALAAEHGAVNLGQGVPAFGPPPGLVEAARAAVGVGIDQYPPLAGLPELHDAIRADRLTRTGLTCDDVLVTVGATEALTASILALAGPGDEVVVLEPAFDSYAAAADLAGARTVPVPLRLVDGRCVLDAEALRSALTEHTRVVIVNTPHNPSGTVWARAEMALLADVLDAFPQVTVLSDEVYEQLLLDDVEHVSAAHEPRLAGRTLVASSLGKTFSVTGWKTGWLTGPAPLVAAARAAKQYLTFAVNAPYQRAAAHALTSENAAVEQLRETLRGNRDRLVAGLRAAGWDVLDAPAGYFVLARPASGPTGDDLARALPVTTGVVAIPVSAFFRGDPGGLGEYVRFSFARTPAEIDEAVARLTR